MNSIGVLGAAPVVVILSLGLALILGRRRDWTSVAFVLSAVGLAAALTGLIKVIVARSRPSGAIVDLWDSQWSFPSGHAALSLAFFGSAALVLLGTATSRVQRRVIVASAAAVVVLVGLSRIVGGAHDLLDIAAGYLVGLLSVGAGRRISGHGASKARLRPH